VWAMQSGVHHRRMARKAHVSCARGGEYSILDPVSRNMHFTFITDRIRRQVTVSVAVMMIGSAAERQGVMASQREHLEAHTVGQPRARVMQGVSDGVITGVRMTKEVNHESSVPHARKTQKHRRGHQHAQSRS